MAKLAVIFPGIGYTCDKPLLYYGERIALTFGYESKRVGYTLLDKSNIRGNREKMEEAFHLLYDQAAKCLADVNWDQYDEILFISKSIGTIIATAYANTLKGKEIRHVLYTPLEDTFRFRPEKAISFIGTADPWSDPREVIRLAKDQGVPMYVYEDLNHSLEGTNVLKNLDTLKDVMEKTTQYLSR